MGKFFVRVTKSGNRSHFSDARKALAFNEIKGVRVLDQSLVFLIGKARGIWSETCKKFRAAPSGRWLIVPGGG
jgi:hypothetical protein